MTTRNPTGLTPAELNQLASVLGQHPPVQRAVLFGSRAKGCARPNSDIDLALYGNLPDLLVERIADELDQLPLPYLFDVKAVDNLQNPALLDHIQRVGFEIYAATVTPDKERWVLPPEADTDLQSALAWSSQHLASSANTDAILQRLNDAEH